MWFGEIPLCFSLTVLHDICCISPWSARMSMEYNRVPVSIFSVLAERDVFLVDLEWSAASRDSEVAQKVILDSDQCEKSQH